MNSLFANLPQPRWRGLIFSVLFGWTAVHAATPVADIKTIDRPDFSLDYPASWREDTTGDGYDKDKNFVLNSPQQSYVQFIIGDAGDPEKLLHEQLGLIDGPTITADSKLAIAKWGHFPGVGMRLKGKILDSFPGGIEVFVFEGGHHSVTVIEYYLSSELKDAIKDMQLISDSFKIKNDTEKGADAGAAP
jgi:hypothetical protein